jgi:hypothetical protein
MRQPVWHCPVKTLSAVTRRAKRAVRRLLRNPDLGYRWSIGIYEGPSPCHLSAATAVSNPVLSREEVSDIPAQFVADPFMLDIDGTWHMFFEVMNRTTRRGEIGLATSGDGARWTYQSIVLREPFHLSYPYVFEWDGEYFMVPESYQAGGVRLYRAERFPSGWKLVGVLVEGPYLVDASLFRAADRWWMFVETNADLKCDTLRLYSSSLLEAGWCEHPSSPVVAGNAHVARPAGRVLVDEGRIIRFAQDCDPRYGLSVSAFEVLDLTANTYRERSLTPAPILGAGPSHWNRDGMHHVDAHRRTDGRWTACVDGWFDMDHRFF